MPARVDLDTALSKISPRLVQDVLVIQGPYGVRYGPGFRFAEVELQRAPRYEDGREVHGSTGIDYRTNGQGFYGRQSFWGGGENWGMLAGYGHRTGNDYQSGDGSLVPFGHKSRDWNFSWSWDPSEDSRLDFTYLRLDQTDVEYPGQAFDMDFLVSDAYELEYVLEDQPSFDRLEFEVWYNRTRFAGSAQRTGKRRTFPFYDFLNFVGHTDVDSSSLGYQLALSWDDDEQSQWTVGADLRYLNQVLNEITSGAFAGNSWFNAN